MVSMILPIVMATTLFINTSLPTPSPVPQTVFTRVLPEKNFVTHDVVKNETLISLAKDYYKNEDFWKLIWNDNPSLKNPDNLENEATIKLRYNVPSNPEQLSQELQTRYDDIVKANTPPPTYTSTFSPSTSPSSQPTSISTYDDVYKQAGEKFGVPWQILYGIHMTETGGRNGAIMSGYGSGAQGPMQFMPGTFRAYAVKADGNGEANINDANDAIFTAANYLANHGSVDNALRAYGGNSTGVIQLAKERGY